MPTRECRVHKTKVSRCQERGINARPEKTARVDTQRQRERGVRHTQGAGCAAGEFSSGLGWKLRLC